MTIRRARALRAGAAGLGVGLTVLACAVPLQLLPAPAGGGIAVEAETALAFQERADDFYQHLIQRRFNTLETFHDPKLREHFRTDDLFFDYYADLAQAFADAHFEKSRPFAVVLEEFLFETPEQARVQLRFRGNDGRPLRPGRVELIRRDRWELADGSWWLIPGKL